MIQPSSIMQPLTLRQRRKLMILNTTEKIDFTHKVKAILSEEPGLSAKELAERLTDTNRQFIAGVLKVLEERSEVSCRQVGLAQIYYMLTEKGKGK